MGHVYSLAERFEDFHKELKRQDNFAKVTMEQMKKKFEEEQAISTKIISSLEVKCTHLDAELRKIENQRLFQGQSSPDRKQERAEDRERISQLER